MTIQKRYDFTQSPLYRLRNKKKLASILNLSSHLELNRLLKDPNLYRKFPLEKGGKVRQVETPSRVLLPVHTRIFRLLNRLSLPDYIHSGVKGRSYISNAKAHLGQIEAYTLDIKKFYPSVTRSKVAQFFRETMLCDKDIAAILACLTTCDGYIPTGSPVSQLLAYFSCSSMFDEIHDASKSVGLKFTCYVDDLTFSGDKVSKRWIYNTIKPIIKNAGLSSHKDKHFKKGQAKEITGVIVQYDTVKVCNRMHHSIHKILSEIGETADTAGLNKLYLRLIGKLSAAGQIEKRFKEQRVKVTQNQRRLHIRRQSMKAIARLKLSNRKASSPPVLQPHTETQ